MIQSFPSTASIILGKDGACRRSAPCVDPLIFELAQRIRQKKVDTNLILVASSPLDQG